MADRQSDPRRPVEIVRPKSGSAYRIGGRLVLTARHLFPDGVGSCCEVRDKHGFGTTEAKVVWMAPDADVALVEWPEAMPACPPVTFGRLPDTPFEEVIRFTMYGWPKWAETLRGYRVMAGGRRLPGHMFLDDTSPDGLLVLELDRGPEIPSSSEEGSDWSGLSGAAVVYNHVVIAVQSQHANRSRARSLEATPLSGICEDADGYHWLTTHGIEVQPVDVMARREKWQADHYQRVINEITSELKALGDDDLKVVAAEVAKRAGTEAEASGIDCKYSGEDLAKPLATCLVNHRPVTEALRWLLDLMKQGAASTRANRIGKVIDYLLPLNYAPHLVDHLRAAVRNQGLALVEGEVATRTLAEIIMAGYDEAASRFDPLTTQNTNDVAGQMALDCEEGPEVGPDDEDGTDFGVRLAARNLLRDLVALKDMVERRQKTALPPGRHQQHHDSDLDPDILMRQIDNAAKKLQASLRSLYNNYDRTAYCIMAPLSEAPQRDFRREVLDVVYEHAPQLIFVELVSEDDADAGEYELQSDIVFRLAQTQQG